MSNLINKPMRLTLEHWDQKSVIEKDHSDIDLEEFMEMIRLLAYTSGFNNESIDEYFERKEQ